MSSEQVSAARPSGRQVGHCRDCGAAVINRAATHCWLCHAPLSPRAADDSGGREQTASSPPREPRQSSDFMVFLGIMVLLLCLGLAGVAPGVLIVLLIVLTPILIRTFVRVSAQKAQGESPSGLAVIGQFFSSLAVVALVGLASIAAFYATCFAVCLAGAGLSRGKGGEEPLIVFSVVSGSVVGIFVLVALIRYLRRRRGGV